MAEEPAFPLDFSSEGDVTSQDAERAQEKLTQIAGLAPDRVIHGQLRLSMAQSTAPAPSRVRPARVEGSLNVGGQVIRAQVADSTMQEAIDRFADRLRSRLTRFAGRQRARREALADAAGANGTDRPDYFDRPPEEREIVRRKSFAAPLTAPEEAVFDMESLDHEFFLFRNAATGQESVVHRAPDGGYELIQTAGTTGDPGVEGTSIRLSSRVPATIPLREAVTALNISDEPFVFFVDADDNAGAVIYRRYDGHYGLITLDN